MRLHSGMPVPVLDAFRESAIEYSSQGLEESTHEKHAVMKISWQNLDSPDVLRTASKKLLILLKISTQSRGFPARISDCNLGGNHELSRSTKGSAAYVRITRGFFSGFSAHGPSLRAFMRRRWVTETGAESAI
jgi:hypothetical protein